jgi:hypothetical protein
MSNCKKCSKCGESKPLDKFGKDKQRKDGLYPQCKDCRKANFLANREVELARAKKWRDENPERAKQTKKEYYINNKEKINKQNQEWAENNREKSNAIKKRWHERNLEKVKAKGRNYLKNNREKIYLRHNEYRKKKYDTDELFKLSCAIRNSVAKIARRVRVKKGKTSLEYLGCSLEEFKVHIESQWQEGMSWENHGFDGWHIDHIKPIDWYIKHSDDPWQANHYTNLQPLWAEENMSKSNKFE